MQFIEINKRTPTQPYMPLNLMHCFQAKKKVTKVASERCNGKQFFRKKGKYDRVRTKYG
jgi:hypothetical protein